MKNMYYIIFASYQILLIILFLMFFSFFRTKATKKIVNKSLFIGISTVFVISYSLSWVPLFFKVWNVELAKDMFLLTLIITVMSVFVLFMIVLSVFGYDFGIIIDEKNEEINFLGDKLNISKIIALEKGKFALKVVYLQGLRKITKKISIYTPSAKAFLFENLSPIIAKNQKEASANTNTPVQVQGVTESLSEVKTENEAEAKVINE